MKIEMKDLERSFGSGEAIIHAVKRCNLHIKEGTHLAITGSSGSGKTTLLNLIGGLDQPSSGSVLFDGQDLYQMNRDERAIFRRKNIGFVFQSYNLIPELTVKENIMVPRMLDGRNCDETFFEEISSVLQLSARLDAYPEELSGGQQQRTAIARAIINKPSVILCDEPTGNLDKENSSQVANLLLLVAERVCASLIIVTHEKTLAEKMGNTLIMDDGELGGDFL